MSPPEARARSARTRTQQLRRLRSRDRTARGVVFALLPLITLGMGSWAVLLFAAIRLRSKRLGAAAAGYAAVLVAAFIIGGNAPQDSPRANDLGYLLILLALGGAAHAFAIRHTVFDGPATTDPQGAAIATWQQTQRLRSQARAICARDPQEALDLLIGRADLLAWRRTFPDGGLIDVNNVPAQTLEREAGLDRKLADRIVETRGGVGGFDSVDDLSVALGLPAPLLDTVADRLVFLPLLPANRTAS